MQNNQSQNINPYMSSLTIQQKKERILKGVASIPCKNLVGHIIEGIVTKEEITEKLKELAKESKISEIENLLAVFENEEWQKAVETNTASSFAVYLDKFPDGVHSTECRSKLSELDEQVWLSLQSNLREASLKQYKKLFPKGKHIEECDALLGDLPWLYAKELGTITAYTEYMAQYPGLHDFEAKQAILNIDDEKDWENAVAAGNSTAYQAYLQKHPTGKHAQQAQYALNASAGHDKIINELKASRNAYTPLELQKEVGNLVITWDDLKEIFNDDELDAIKSYRLPTNLPYGDPPQKLEEGPTEVYFWGTPSSGKTCALGAILSAANKYGIFTGYQTPGKGGRYRDLLSNIFDSKGICVFPEGTPDTSIQQMIFTIRDSNKKEHLITFVDLAGELFRSMYYKINDEQYFDENFDSAQKQALDCTLSYLNDLTNKKIHFFIVAYGEERQRWRGEDIYMVDFLKTTMKYLDDNKVLQKGTNGVYILVTKCDNMPCAPEERAEFAERYVKENMISFYESVKSICEDAGVRDFEVIPFSVGDVFAQKLCKFKSDNTDNVLNKLISKTPTIKKGFVKWLKS